MPDKKISVLICTRNRPQDIVWAVPSVLKNEYPNYEVIVVDQSDGDETRRIVASHFADHPNLRYVPTETRGLSYARNLAISESTGEIIAFTDDDCETGTHWVSDVASLFEQDADLAIVYGQVHMPEELRGKDVAVPCLYFEEKKVLKRGEVLGMGANMAFRRSLLDKAGIYDPLLGAGAPFPGGEDFDLTYRAQLVGAKVVADPSLVLTHRAFRTNDKWQGVLRSYGAGDAAFFAKHARCGDGWARRQIGTKLLIGTLRAAAKFVLRRSNEFPYLQGFWSGLWQSRRYSVDTQKRVYLVSGYTSHSTPMLVLSSLL